MSNHSDNSSSHPYMRHDFWIDRKSWFWDNDMYTARSKKYFEKFVAEQAKLAERKFKGV